MRISALGPGLLVAATGVGAGDLATATFTGAHLGTAILWAVVIGAALKYLLNEGLTRWQLATGTTILEGAVLHLGRPMQWTFMLYLLFWSYLVAMALMSACGVAAQAIYPITDDPSHGKIVYGILHSLIAATLVIIGGYRLFEKIMSVCIAVMFVVVCFTAVALGPDLVQIFYGLTIPSIPQWNSGGLEWTIALLGGVGGTVTILCYGYWIREEGRTSTQDLKTCRIDLAAGYFATAFFGLAMVIIGSQLGELDARGATLIIRVAETLQQRLGGIGHVAKWAFLVGAWGAVFSSLLGVWQSVPYLYADFWRLLWQHRSLQPPSRTQPTEDSSPGDESPEDQQRKVPNAIDGSSPVYRAHLAAIAIVPISGLILIPFNTAMKVNGMVGALFLPMLAVVLLILNGRTSLVGKAHANSNVTSLLLVLTLLFFVVAGGLQIAGRLP
jgi:Mn2+/Fe2+ NRAMP family transporter